jgi:hypothetical protein
MNNKSSQTISSSGGNQASVANNGNGVLKWGLVVHDRQVTEFLVFGLGCRINLDEEVLY